MSIKENISAIDVSFVSGLLQDVFGVANPVYITDTNEPRAQAAPFPGVEMETAAPDYDNAPVRYGQPTWGAFWLKGGTYLTFQFNAKPQPEEFSDFLMPLATLVTFKRAKTVTKTPTSGGGTVKEIYGLADWDITINGIILPDKYNPANQQTVEEQMEALQRYHEIAGSIEVDGQIFAKRNITRIVTEDFSFDPVQGYPDMMQFSIQAVSDEDLLLTDIL